MPTIWLKDRTGRVFHFTTPIASWAGDYNTPETSIPANTVVKHANSLEIKIGQNTLTMNLGQHGACMQCGQCCSHPRAQCPAQGGKCGYRHHGKNHICEHLLEHPLKGGIGTPGGTICKIYKQLLDEGMKGCVTFPESAADISRVMSACGMRFK